MALEVQCPECNALLRIEEENANRQARCPTCAAVFTPGDVASPEVPLSETMADPTRPVGAPPSPSAEPSGNPYAPTYVEPTNQPMGTVWAPQRISADEILSRAWAVFKTQWVMACVAVIIVQAVNFGGQMIQGIGLSVIEQMGNDPVARSSFQALTGLLFGIVQVWLTIGQTMIMFDIARGRQVEIGKLFSGAQFLLSTIVATIIVMIFVGTIMVVFVGVPTAAVALSQQGGDVVLTTVVLSLIVALVPATIVGLIFSQFQMLIIDRGMGPIDALRVSAQITNGNKLTLFFMFILLTLIFIGAMIVGVLALCLGVIPAMIGYSAYAALVLVVAYLMMTGQGVAGAQRAFEQPVPNYGV